MTDTPASLRFELEGDYRLSVLSPSGRELSSLHGSGRKSYRPRPFRDPGLYLVRIETRGRNYLQKIMIY